MDLKEDIVQARKARSTGTLVLVVDNRNHCLDDDPSVPWFTVCSDHGGCVGHPTRKIATDWAAAPEDWCPTCRGDEPAEPGESFVPRRYSW